MQPTIIYILGAGNSGSTLLSMALGGHSQIASVGELAQMDRWLASGGLCSCGTSLPHCDIWGPIINSADENRPSVPLAPVPEKTHPWSSNSKRFRSDIHMPLTVDRNVDLYKRIQTSSGCDTIVDASKNALQFYYLYRSGYIRIVPILLVRDGEEYLESSVRRGGSFLASILRWVGLNLSALQALKETRMSKNAVHVRYRDLVENPEETLQSICASAGLKYEPEMLAFHKKPHHNVAGTRTRFLPRPIESKESSRHNLSRWHRFAYWVIGGHFWNRFFDS